jgi:hypothetical protein
MVEIQHPRTGTIRKIVELGHTVYGPSSFKIVMDNPLCKLNRRTPRELINRGQTREVLRMLAADFNNQRV